MAFFSISNVSIAGLSATLPANEVRNSELSLIPEKDRDKFIKMTGIDSRRIAPKGLTAADLCEDAARRLLGELGWERDEVEALVMVTQTPDYGIPANAMLLQDRLGLSKSCLAFDINQGCAGYVYGLSSLASMISATGIKKALLLVGDTISQVVSQQDRSTAPIFADAGSATALVYDEKAPPMHFNLQSDGAGYKAIISPAGGQRNPANPQAHELDEIAPGILRAAVHMGMEGLDVFNFALKEVVPNIKEALEKSGLESDWPDHYVFHQANLLLNETLRKKMGLPREKTPLTLSKYGNTSCATLPLTLVSELGEILKQQNLNLCLSGFGVGLSWGSALLSCGKMKVPGIHFTGPGH